MTLEVCNAGFGADIDEARFFNEWKPREKANYSHLGQPSLSL